MSKREKVTREELYIKNMFLLWVTYKKHQSGEIDGAKINVTGLIYKARRSSSFFGGSFFNVLGLIDPVVADTVGKFSAAAALSARKRSKSLEVTDSSGPVVSPNQLAISSNSLSSSVKGFAWVTVLKPPEI